jgi:sugar phosphate isomerase/epimerase
VRPLSLDHLTVIEASPVELIEAAAAGGFAYAGLRIVQPLAAATVADVIGNAALRRDLKAAMAATGVSVRLIESIWLGPEANPSALEGAFAAGAELGARFALVAGNDPERTRLVDNLGRLADLANNHALEIAFEFMPFTQVCSYDDALRIKRDVGRNNLRLLIDALHLSRSGQDFHTLAPFDSSIVSYVHLCDARGDIPAADKLRDEARQDRFDPGDGDLPLEAFLDAMPADACLGIEAPYSRHADLSPIERGRIAGRTAREWLRRYEGRHNAKG